MIRVAAIKLDAAKASLFSGRTGKTCRQGCGPFAINIFAREKIEMR